MEAKVRELSRYRFKKAEKSLLISKKLFEEGEYGYSQNRAYYALFDAIRSVTVLDSFDSSKHSGIIAYFNQHYVKTGLFDQKTSAVIRLASMLREKSDYEDFYEPDEDDTKSIIESITEFLNSVKKFLRDKEVF